MIIVRLQALEHRVGVLRSVRDALNYVPVFYKLSIFDPEEINSDVTILTNEAGPAGMHGNKITVSQHMSDVPLGIGKVRQKSIDVFAQAFHAVLTGRRVLDIGIADVAGDRAVDVTVEVRFLVEGEYSFLVLCGDGFGRHDDFQSDCRRPSWPE